MAIGKHSLNSSDMGIFRNMLAFDQLRGEHSTGCFGFFREGATFTVNKQQLEGVDFVRTPHFMEAVARKEKLASGIELVNWASAVFGHNRYATVGAVNARNAHPFTHGKITLAHNGTLRDQSLLPDSHKFEVDSENVCYSIDKIGVEATIQKLNGAFALIWFNAEEQTINLIRNTEREFHLFETTTGDWFGCSEEKMGDWLITRGKGGRKIKSHFELVPGVQYIFDVSKTPVTMREVVHTLPSFPHYSRSYSNFQGYSYGSYKKEPEKKADNSKEALLKKYEMSHLSIGSHVEFETCAFRQYKNNKGTNLPRGEAIGWLVNKNYEYIEVQCHNVLVEEFTRNTKGYGELIGVFELNECLHLVVKPNPDGIGKPYPLKNNPTASIRAGFDCNGKYLTKDAWEKASKGGCPTCGHTFKWDGESHLAEILHGYIICADDEACNKRVVKLEAALALPQEVKKDDPLEEYDLDIPEEILVTSTGETFTATEWKKSPNNTCAQCGDPIPFEDIPDVRIENGNYAFCGACVEDKAQESKPEPWQWCEVCNEYHTTYVVTGNMDVDQWTKLPVNCPTKIKFKDKFSKRTTLSLVKKKEERKPCQACNEEYLDHELTGGMCKICRARFQGPTKNITQVLPANLHSKEDVDYFKTGLCPDCGEYHSKAFVDGQLPLAYYEEQLYSTQCRLAEYWFLKKKERQPQPITKRLTSFPPMLVTESVWNAMNTCRGCGTRIPYEDVESVNFVGASPLCADCHLDKKLLEKVQ